MAATSRKRPAPVATPAKRARDKKSGKRRAKTSSRPGAGEVELVKMAHLARRSGVPAPTIKHYIREGLLPGPELRTSRNMAYYDARLAARIRVIKSLQAEQFLPLRVIAELLEPAPSSALRNDKTNQKRALVALAPVFDTNAASTQRSHETRRKKTDVIKSGITRAELDRLEKGGILELRGDGETAGYSGPDLDMLDVLAELRRAGLGHVFSPTLAESYLAQVKQLVAMEIELFRKTALAAELPVPLADVARKAAGFGERIIVALRAKLLPALLGDAASDD